MDVHRRRKNRPGNALSLAVHCDPACTGQYGEGLLAAQEMPNGPGEMPRDKATPSRAAAGISRSTDSLRVSFTCTDTT